MPRFEGLGGLSCFLVMYRVASSQKDRQTEEAGSQNIKYTFFLYCKIELDGR